VQDQDRRELHEAMFERLSTLRSLETLNISDLVRGVQTDLARERNAIAVAAMLAAKGLSEALVVQLPGMAAIMATDLRRGASSSAINDLVTTA